LGEVPRNFSVNIFSFLDLKVNDKKKYIFFQNKKIAKNENIFFWQIQKIFAVKPEYNAKKDCYQLNFYVRAKKASARNFYLIFNEDPDSILLMHGKAKGYCKINIFFYLGF
jgi:hypothetical protein